MRFSPPAVLGSHLWPWFNKMNTRWRSRTILFSNGAPSGVHSIEWSRPEMDSPAQEALAGRDHAHTWFRVVERGARRGQQGIRGWIIADTSIASILPWEIVNHQNWWNIHELYNLNRVARQLFYSHWENCFIKVICKEPIAKFDAVPSLPPLCPIQQLGKELLQSS